MAARQLVATGITLAAIAFTAGCGSSSSSSDATPAAKLTGPELTQRVATALDAATSVHLHGTLSNLQSGSGLAGTLDASATHDAESGSVTTPSSGSLKMVILPKTVYLNGDAGFWNSSASSDDDGSADQSAVISAKLANRWVSVPADSSDPSVANGYTLADLAGGLRTPASGTAATLDAVTSTQVDGHQVFVISQKDGSKLYVDHTTLLPVRMVNSASNPNGAASIDFDQYNAKVSIVAPNGAVTMKSLLGVTPG